MITTILCAIAFGQAGVNQTLWQIGAFDGNDAEFALAPGRYREYRDDPSYVIGISTPNSWPYVLPGPSDDWAGRRTHRDSVFFGLRGAGTSSSQHQASGKGKGVEFICDFVETHYASPPQLTLWVNGKRVAAWQAPAGISDEAIYGHPEKGRHASWAAEIPAATLVDGINELQIRNERGGWVLFDALRLEGPDSLRVIPVRPGLIVEPLGQDQVVIRTPEGPRQRINLEVTNFGKPGKLEVAGDVSWSGDIPAGAQTIAALIPAVQKPKKLALRLSLGGIVRNQSIEVQPVRPWTVYLLPHSHVDIGYTDLQPVVAAMHRRNLFDAISVAKESPSYRFNGEATWILDNLLQDGTPDELRQVASAFRAGTMDSSADYCNVLTGLMRPEELMRSYGFSDRLRNWLGVDLTTATQTDVPGVTWGAVAAMSQAGVKNLILMPNPADRIGGVLSAWQDKPFFWVSPSGREKVLVWETASYGVAHGLRHFNGDRTKIFRTADPTKNFIDGYIFDRLNMLAEQGYPYDCIAFPWSGTDNFPVDADVPAAVRHWNEVYVTPHVVASTFSGACDALVKKCGSRIPSVKGDFTPYWEDGAGSSARETAMNRTSADRLIQAETLCAIASAAQGQGARINYDPKSYWRAWSDVILYSEHTWGAYNSISEPDAEFVKKQWAHKQNFAVEADKMSRELLASSSTAYQAVSASGFQPENQGQDGPGTHRLEGDATVRIGEFSVVNTTSWPRSDLVVLPKEQSQMGDRVLDGSGHPFPSQRLHTGELAVLARNVPAFGSVKLRVVAGKAFVDQKASASSRRLSNPDWQIERASGSNKITKLWSNRLKRDFAKAPYDINQYNYLSGADLHNLKEANAGQCEVIERGPLVATFRITSSAAGVRSLTQDVQLVAGLDRVDFDNKIDKVAVREKEGVHFAFPFNVPSGQLRIQGPWAVIRPDLDQIAGSNKNWFTTQYFADVSNDGYGVTWSSLDAPLMEVGGITANMLDGGYSPKQWIQHIGPTQTIYSWALNNHWYTNYRADQEGLLTFRYSIRAHGRYAPDDAYRFGAGLAQPLLVCSTAPDSPLLKISDPRVVVSALKPSEDGKALIVRLWCAGDRPSRVRLVWRPGVVGRLSLSDSSERPTRPCGSTIPIAGWQVMTVRAELR
ncbi:MAG: polysaccharide lyase family protein [Fimbriimonadales bacterium]